MGDSDLSAGESSAPETLPDQDEKNNDYTFTFLEVLLVSLIKNLLVVCVRVCVCVCVLCLGVENVFFFKSVFFFWFPLFNWDVNIVYLSFSRACVRGCGCVCVLCLKKKSFGCFDFFFFFFQKDMVSKRSRCSTGYKTGRRMLRKLIEWR